MELVIFLRELKIEHSKPLMHIDNRSTIRMIKNNDMQRRTKHVNIKFHFVREKYAEKLFELCAINTEN